MTTLPEEPERPGLRERRKQSTRRALEDAALRLFARDGFDATTIEAIAAEAEVSPRTFFRYFASKDEVLNPEREQRQGQLADEIRRGAEEPVDDLALVVRALVALAPQFEAEQEQMALRRQAASSSALLRGRLLDVLISWEHAVARALAERHGTERHDLGPEVTAAAAVHVWQVALARWLRDPSTGLADQIEAAFAALAQAGSRDTP
ncbi:MAG: TetR family transcriptional regulator [Nocardioides sp.]|nr:TetR family transcriptional regulator [Nocardioides sp.]